MTTVFQRIGAYDVVEEIGRGGMAAVFLARDRRHDRKVALKLVPLKTSGEGLEILNAERWGTRLQARISADCALVPRVYEDGELPPYYFIAMEYVEGENLSDVIARGAVPPARAVSIAADLCRFLDTAHRFETRIDGQPFRSLLHGDLKPGNVRVTADGSIKVLDFGIAKALSLSRKVTRNDFGSMPYMSPERLDSAEPRMDAHADLWALGVILYELVSGAAPFQSRDMRGLERQIREGYARRPLPASVPKGLQAIASRLLAPALSDRYPAAAAVLEDLQRFTAGSPTEAERAGFPSRLDEAPTQRTRPPEADEPTRRTHPVAEPAGDPGAPRLDAAATSDAPRAASPQARPAAPRRHRLRAALAIGALLLVLNEISVGFAAGRLGAAASTQSLDGLSATWEDYARLSRRSHLRIGVLGLEDTLRARVRQLADEVIADYRGPTPAVRERQWRAAQRNLQQALTLAPADRRLRAALRYCEGHLHRIDGEAEKQRRRPTTASRHFAEAVSAFREAAELRDDWPDPFLGLARTFIYGLEDVERAADAMRQAQRLGYTTGDREAAQLGDGYRARGDNLRQTARQLAQLPQEEEYLERAAEAYREALTLYERIPGYAGSAANIRRIRRALDDIELRRVHLAIAKASARLPGTPWE
jgi:serine/threonine protein kinase